MNKFLILPMLLLVVACTKPKAKEHVDAGTTTDRQLGGSNVAEWTIVKECVSGTTIYRVEGKLATWVAQDGEARGGHWDVLDSTSTPDTFCNTK